MIGIIQYFKRLKGRWNRIRQIKEENNRRFYAKCKEGIFSFFNPTLTEEGFYLNLRDKSGLKDYLLRESGKTIEKKILTSNEADKAPTPLYKKEEGDKKTIYGLFERMINYFREFPKNELEDYTSLSFSYNPMMRGYEIIKDKNKLKFRFG